MSKGGLLEVCLVQAENPTNINCSQSILLGGFLIQFVSHCLLAKIFATVLITKR